MKRKIFLMMILFLIVDILSKVLVIKFDVDFNIIPNFLDFIFVKNSGAAFSILSGNTPILIVVALFTVICLVYFIKDNKLNKLECIGYSLFLSGILGNLIDRIYYGYVVDFIHFYVDKYSFPVFNIADILIVTGAFILILNIVLGDKHGNNSRKK